MHSTDFLVKKAYKRKKKKERKQERLQRFQDREHKRISDLMDFHDTVMGNVMFCGVKQNSKKPLGRKNKVTPKDSEIKIVLQFSSWQSRS